jgi:NCAIR mutase (PurE)-related protein
MGACAKRSPAEPLTARAALGAGRPERTGPIDQHKLQTLLESVRDGTLTPQAASEALKLLPFEDLEFARADHHRELRGGFPEVILGLGKTPAQVATIGSRILAQSGRLLVTRASEAQFSALLAEAPDALFHETARAITVDRVRPSRRSGIVVVCAGTSDLPVAEEAALTAEMLGNSVQRLNDVGVAGLHRLLASMELLVTARVMVVVAGMEGALPSVVGGLVSCPVIAVPTSIGYGASFNGLAALLGMLNSCAAGVCVVNIDNGFGAGYMAALINRLPAVAAADEP